MGLVQPGLGLMIWMSIAFLIVLFLLTKFAWKPILASLKERESSIDDALKAAEHAREEMARLNADNEKILQEAKEEKSKIIKEAKEAGDRMINEAKEKAKTESAKMIEEAKREIDNQKKAALTEVKNTVGNIAVEIAEKMLRRELKQKEEQEAYIKTLVEDINAN